MPVYFKFPVPLKNKTRTLGCLFCELQAIKKKKSISTVVYSFKQILQMYIQLLEMNLCSIYTKIIWLVITTVDYLRILKKPFQLMNLPAYFFLKLVFRKLPYVRIILACLNSLLHHFKSSLLNSGDWKFNLKIYNNTQIVSICFSMSSGLTIN